MGGGEASPSECSASPPKERGNRRREGEREGEGEGERERERRERERGRERERERGRERGVLYPTLSRHVRSFATCSFARG